MARYRPSQVPASAYITAEGAARLRAEMLELWSVERPRVTAVVTAAAKNGDRSENGDYIYGKRRLREIDRRVRYLSKRLETVTIVDQLPQDQNRVFFGAWVSVEDELGKQARYRLVGSDEIDPGKGYISVDSPVALALLGKGLGDTVELRYRGTARELLIVGINYNPC